MKATSRQLAARWFEEVWNQRRTETIHELLAPNAAGHMEGQEVVGAADFLAVHQQMLQLIPDLKITVDDVLADEDDAVVRWTLHGTHSGEGMGLAPTFQPVVVNGMTWFKFRNEQIVEGWDRWNYAGLVQVLSGPALG